MTLDFVSKTIGWMHSGIEAGEWTEKHVKQKMFPKRNANSPFLLLCMGLFFNALDSTTSFKLTWQVLKWAHNCSWHVLVLKKTTTITNKLP